MSSVSIFWFRRDLRLDDNTGLAKAIESSSSPILPIFIFDKNILDELTSDDARVTFIHDTLSQLNNKLSAHGSGVKAFYGTVKESWRQIIQEYEIESVYCNHDYEPYAIARDNEVASLLQEMSIPFHTSKDQVIHEKEEVVKPDGKPYTVFTPYKKKWLDRFDREGFKLSSFRGKNLIQSVSKLPSLAEMGFTPSDINVAPFQLDSLPFYHESRDYPAKYSTSFLGPHLRFGTVSPRQLLSKIDKEEHSTFVSELIWREFFMQILWNFPHVVIQNFNSKYDGIEWRNDEEEFRAWCEGKTGYPLVDAGMRQLNATGYMHNRVRMVTASFLCKHLLIDWRWGEAYFASKLLDFELASNNGNWQWCAGTGCDAAPYFRVFNPSEQLKKFDSNLEYTKEWVPEVLTEDYPPPMVEHKFARERALEAYKTGINSI